VLVVSNDFKCELGNNQFQIDGCDGHSSPSPPAGCSRKRRHSRGGPHLSPSSASPHAPQPCPNDQLTPCAGLWQMVASPSPLLYYSTNSRIPQYAAERYKRTLRVSWWAQAAPPNGLLPRLCTACCMDHPGRLSWFGERGAEGSISGCLARQRGFGNEVRARKASPPWRMLNHVVLQHRCAPVPSPATERSKTALEPTITYVKFIEKIAPHKVIRRDDPLRPCQAESSSHEASHERRKC